ncbi:S1 family peptidase [Streptomyces yerevanensis]|uniref:S1 family peptidase n=1 Tax=Streptomyces yerevanensis TaxID=66378 RepID=UPI0012FF1508|nr:S1 family peptidase [Streptomyces yerevanensis]
MPPKGSHARRPRPLKAAAFGLGLLTVLGIAGISVAGEDSGSASTTNTVKAVDASRRDEVFGLVNAADIPGLDGFSVGIDPVAEKIGVHLFVPEGLSAAAKEALQFGDDVTVTVQEASAPASHVNASGGASIGGLGSGSCTTGFAVGLANGQSGFITAGHCFTTGVAANQQTALIGSVPSTGHSFNFGSSDWGIYSLNDSPDTNDALPQVISDNGTHPVRGITAPTVGLDICKHGITTGTTCGKVTLVNTRVTYREVKDSAGNIIKPGAQVNGVIQSDLCSEPGDSGSAVYTRPAAGSNTAINAVAVHSGGSTVKLSGRDVCLEKAGFNNVAWHVPMSATPAKSTNPFDDVFIKVAS